jgi:hypothetical protein
MSIVSSANIISYLDVSTYDASIQAIHEGVEAYLKQATNQPWESTTYTNKAYDGTGGSILLLEEKPIISVKSVILDPFGEAENVKINKSSGQLLYSYFPRGFQNIIVTYTAGYSTIPADITLWIMNTVKTLYMVKLNSVEGITSFRVGDISYTYGEIAKAGINIPDSILKQNVNLRI